MQAQDSYCHLVCDEGKEDYYVKLVRKLRVYNPIPSQFGAWNPGEFAKNIPIERIIEDPQFKDSRKSYFIQHADFMAFGLLRSEKPTPKIKRHGAHKSLDQLDESLNRVCNKKDPRGMGIIR